jgi:cytochrome c peroxidase
LRASGSVWAWRLLCGLIGTFYLLACASTGSSDGSRSGWEADNPLRPLPTAPLGTEIALDRLKDPPTPARVRLGRWLFFDRRLSADSSMSCASCHQPEFAFSQRTPVATGIRGQRGRRKVPPLINLVSAAPPTAFRIGPQAVFFWDGRATSLERQALEPIANPIEMGSSHARMVETLSGIEGYEPYFVEAFREPRITKERIARALADYERTRVSGNSPFDRWRHAHEPDAVSAEAKRGYALFSGKAQCFHCHGAGGFSGGGFHNTGIGWDARTGTFADEGRHAVTKGSTLEAWPGTFKTPTLREVSRHPPYMHDGSIPTLREVIEFYNRGANPNPYLSAFIHPLGLTPTEIGELIAFLNALDGEGWQDAGPSRFPR